VTLIGDAAHTILPFYGQGMNAALEDCAVLADCLARGRNERAPLACYQQIRKPNADAIDELAIEHYHFLTSFSETSDSIRKKELENELQQVYPTILYRSIRWLPSPICPMKNACDLWLAVMPPRPPGSRPRAIFLGIAAVQALLDDYRQASERVRQE